MRIALELFHILIGLAATALIVAAASWAYPLARREIEVSGWIIGAIVVLLGLGQVRRAWRGDRNV